MNFLIPSSLVVRRRVYNLKEIMLIPPIYTLDWFPSLVAIKNLNFCTSHFMGLKQGRNNKYQFLFLDD